jgi:Interferon-induced transmembrane protein.
MAPPAQSYTPPPPPPSYGTPSGYGAPGPGTPGPAIPNYLVQSILVTLCCCLPLGVVAIVFSAQVNSKLAAGDIAGAQDASNKAKMFAWIGFGLGIVVMIIWFAMSGTAVLQGIRDAQANR